MIYYSRRGRLVTLANVIAEGVAAAGLRVARFEFPYMAANRRDGRKRPPDRQPVLLETWRQVIRALGPERLAIGGKSLGGRMASLIADETAVRGLVCLGYPLCYGLVTAYVGYYEMKNYTSTSEFWVALGIGIVGVDLIAVGLLKTLFKKNHS